LQVEINSFGYKILITICERMSNIKQIKIYTHSCKDLFDIVSRFNNINFIIKTDDKLSLILFEQFGNVDLKSNKFLFSEVIICKMKYFH
jgi:hypothetical protein